MGITIDSILGKVLVGWGIDLAELNDFLRRTAEQFPDLAPRVDALLGWLVSRVPSDIAGLVGTLRGIATDIWTGEAGFDPEAWRGSV